MFCELCTSSYYSFLEATSSPEELAEQAASLGMPALGLVDRDGLHGAPLFVRSCQELGIHPVIGARLTLPDDDSCILLCRSQEAYRQLCQLITEAHRGRPKGEPLTQWEMFEKISGHVICLIGGKRGQLSKAAQAGDVLLAQQVIKRYQTQFGADQTYVVLAHHCEEGDAALSKALYGAAQSCNAPVVASNLPQYAKRELRQLHDVLLCIKHHKVLNEAHSVLSGNAERCIKSEAEMSMLFSAYPEAIANTQRIAEQCQVNLDFSDYRLPDYEAPSGHTHESYLRRLCNEALPLKYPGRDVRERLEEELALICRLKLAGYFLVVWDLVQFARQKQIPVQGRGSAANSLVAYLLGITPVDPVACRLYLGRFLHEGMRSSPDIDLDFASTRDPRLPDREDVIQYVYDKYGRDHVAMVCTFITYKGRSAIREVGKVMEIPQPLLDRMSKLVGHGSVAHAVQTVETTPEFMGSVDPHTWQRFKELLEQISDVPRHLSIHVGGMLIAARPISELVPLEPARMQGRIVCQWDKDMVEDAGLIKVDILGLGMLAVLREAVQLMPEEIDLNTLDFNDPRIYEAIGRADTIGAFQIESRAQMQCLPRTQPSNFHELGVQVAIIRPGPLQGNMVSPYIRRKQGKEPVIYLHESLEDILEDTLGVILFQEQVLQAATRIAGFSPTEADALRRAMSRKRSLEAMARLKSRFLEGAAQRGVLPSEAERVFATLEGFALYGFCKSHALSFAKIVYQSMWLKVYQPAAFAAALLNNQPMGFYAPETLLEDAKRHGVVVLPVDVNASQQRCHVSAEGLRLGLNMIHGICHDTATRIVDQAPYQGLRDCVRRTKLNRRHYEGLIQAGACDSWGLSRRELLWQLWLIEGSRDGPSLFGDMPLTAPPLPKMGAWELLQHEYASLGFSTRIHPMALFRPQLPGLQHSQSLAEAAHNTRVSVAGMAICRQRPPTAKGFCFITLEDEWGLMNIVIPPDSYIKHRALLRQESFFIVRGIIERVDGVTNVKADGFQPITRSSQHA